MTRPTMAARLVALGVALIVAGATWQLGPLVLVVAGVALLLLGLFGVDVGVGDR
jgi:hypothetical protein